MFVSSSLCQMNEEAPDLLVKFELVLANPEWELSFHGAPKILEASSWQQNKLLD